MMRRAEIRRATKETRIRVRLNIDGSGESDIDTGIGFFDHMLTLFSAHGRLDLSVRCDGDLKVDGHHSVEDIGICIGQALHAALGEKRGIRRYAFLRLPMDEALIEAALDISGRPYLRFDLPVCAPMLGGYDTELTEEFFRALATAAGLTLHINLIYGKNSHHIVEGAFKAFARALREAASIEPGNAEIPSTKGSL